MILGGFCPPQPTKEIQRDVLEVMLLIFYNAKSF